MSSRLVSIYIICVCVCVCVCVVLKPKFRKNNRKYHFCGYFNMNRKFNYQILATYFLVLTLYIIYYLFMQKKLDLCITIHNEALIFQTPS